MTHVVIALDNVQLNAEDVDPNMLLAVGMIYNQHLEDNRDKFAKAFSDLVCFGYCEWPVP